MSNLDFIVEVGCEDLPPADSSYIAESGPVILEEVLKSFRVDYSFRRIFVTPRRVALFFTASEMQLSEEEKIKGPPVSAAIKDGEPTKAGLGFAKKFNLEFAQLQREETPKGEYLYHMLKKPSSSVKDILYEIVWDFLSKLTFPVTMKWPGSELKFPRPVRWLTALAGEEPVEFTLCGVSSSKFTWGHYVFADKLSGLEKADKYEATLSENFVIPDPNKRKDMLREAIEAVAYSENLHPLMNEELLSEINNSLEYPGAILGCFPENYLRIPREIVEACLVYHQRYFPLNDSNGELAAAFIGVRDGLPDKTDEIREGFEKVLIARLKDAEFFFNRDRENPLSYYSEKLKGIEFTRGLGTLYDKSLRVKTLLTEFQKSLDTNSEFTSSVERVIELAKADLTTLTVGEFPELEGVIGSIYARLDGESERVSESVLQQYWPRTSEDSLPELDEAAVSGFLDRIDTLVGNIGTGVEASGSQDPYGLRRACRGMLRIAVSKKWDTDLVILVEKSVSTYPADKLAPDTSEKTQKFIRQQLIQYLEESFSYDVARSAAASGADNPCKLFRRAEAIKKIKRSPGFDSLVTALKRAGNIIRQAQDKGVYVPERAVKEYLTQESEKRLFDEYIRISDEVTRAFENSDYFEGLRLVGSLREAVDAFFEEVLVMDKDENIMKNRLALLKGVSELTLHAGNISLLE